MCGIAGIFAKSEDAQARLGTDLADMLIALTDRGPDSAGAAVYGDPAPDGATRVSLLDPSGARRDWTAVAAVLRAFGAAGVGTDRGDQATLHVAGVDDAAARTGTDGTLALRAFLAEHLPELVVLSVGSRIETVKRAGRPGDPGGLIETAGLRGLRGGHALGHTRMATESRVTTEHSHPFSTGPDLCLVHNGSLSNHNRLRRSLSRRGISFATDNDSEVAAGYLTWRFLEGDDLPTALEHAVDDLDGFFTFAIGTRDGFAVMRDPVGCKPAVLAETDDWVAMASEHRAIAVLPGAEDARVWEPDPGRVYSWSREPVAA